METFHLKYRDTRPVLEVQLLNPDESIHDLTGVDAVYLHVWLPDDSKLMRTMTINPDPTTGIVSYTWLATDWTSTPGLAIGKHRMEYEVVDAVTGRLTFPNGSYDCLSILSDVGQGS